MIFKDQTWQQILDTLNRLEINNDSLQVKIIPHWFRDVLVYDLYSEPYP